MNKRLREMYKQNATLRQGGGVKAASAPASPRRHVDTTPSASPHRCVVGAFDPTVTLRF